MMTPQAAIKQADRALDRFLDTQLAKDAALLREHGATDREVRDYLEWKRTEYQAEKHNCLASIIAWVMGRERTDQQPTRLQ
jgi:hypothetical protein